MGQKGGVIVNMTGTRAWPDDVLSAPSLAAFAALEATTHTLALQAGTHQIRLFGVAPEVHLRTRVRKAGQLADRSTRYPLIAFAGSVAVVDSILGLIEDPQAHDATYRLDSGQLF
jgi:NAD(P)-dependent dehydrogenase (short-subunit alcohol dehydrogenase family)